MKIKKLKLKIKQLGIFIITFSTLGFFFLKFTSQSTQAAWFSDSWGFRKKLTIDHTKVSGSADLTSFPVLVSLTDKTLSKSQTTGNDILFTASDGSTKLDHEIEKFDPNTGTLVAWVRIPTLHYQTDDIIYMYYGNPSASSQQNKTGVWDSDYIAVYHLSETSGHHLDSKSTNNSTSETNLTKQGTATGIAGGSDEFNGSSSVVALPAMALGGNNATLEAWVKSNVTTATSRNALARYYSYQELGIYQTPTWTANMNYSQSVNWGTPDTSWHYISETYDGTLGSANIQLFIDGQSRNSRNYTSNITDEDQVWHIGDNGNSGDYWNGIVDEVRLSTTARTAGWLATTYNTINSPSTFFSSRGTEESRRIPVLYWALDNTNSAGTITNAVLQTEDLCVSDKCYLFNGTNANISTTTPVNNVQTISLWIKPNTTTQSILDLDGGSHKISVSSGAITATGFTSVYVNGRASTTLEANKWQHLEATTSTAFSTTTITLGQISTAYFNGFIDEFKLYDYVRSASQIKQDAIRANSSAGSNTSIGAASTDFLNQGLVGYWKMDDNVSGDNQTLIDSSKNGNTATTHYGTNTTGMNCTAIGRFDHSCNFDGIDDYVSVSDSSSLDISQQITISAWVYSNNSATSERLVSKYATAYELMLDVDNHVIFAINNGFQDADKSITSTATTAISGWSYVVGVYNGTSLSVYVDGVGLTESTTQTSIATNNYALYLGDRFERGRPLDGNLDEVRIYNRALSPAEIQTLYSWAPGPVGYWKFDENTGTTAYDSSTNGGSAVLGGGTASYYPLWSPGKHGSSLKFDGVDDYLPTSNTTVYQNFSFSAWVKTGTGAAGGIQSILSKVSYSAVTQNDFPVSMYINDAGTQASVYVNSGNDWSPDLTVNSNLFTANIWHHIAATYDGATLILYVDGIGKSASGAVTLSANSQPWTIGRASQEVGAGIGKTYLNGNIDDVKIYNYARTAAQISQDMAGNLLSVSPPLGKPVVSYDFDEGYGDITHNFGTLNNTTNGDLGGSTNTCPGNATCPTWSNTGKFDKSLSFDGTSDYLSLGTLGSFSTNANSNSFAVSTWIKSNNTTSVMYIGGELNLSNNTALQLMVNSDYNDVLSAGYIAAYYRDSDSSTLAGHVAKDTGVTDGNWHHVVWIINGLNNSLRIYVDGKEQPVTTPVKTLPDNVATFEYPFYLGARNNRGTADGFFAGQLDRVQLFYNDLTSDQVKLLYNQGQSQVMGSNTDATGKTGDFSSAREYCAPGDTTTCSAPVAEWKFDENTGTSAYDSSGNNYTLSRVDDTRGTWVAGHSGSAYKTSSAAVNDYFSISDASSANLDFTVSQSYSYGFWYKYQAAGTNDYLVPLSNGGGNTSTAGYNIEDNLSTNTLSCNYSDGDSTNNGNLRDKASYTINLLDNSWHYIYCVMDRSGTAMGAAGLYLFVDGRQVGSDTSLGDTTINTNSSDFSVGEISPSYDYDSVIDNLRVYDYARTPAQIAWDYNHGAPIAKYDFDECTGATLNDTAPKSDRTTPKYTGTIVPGSEGATSAGNCNTNATSLWYLGRSGKYSGSLEFDGADDAITIAANSALNLDKGGTIAAWIYPHSAGENNYGRIIDKSSDGSGTGGYDISMNNGQQIVLEINNQAVYSSTSGSVPYNNWSHVVCTFDGTNWKTFINGKLNTQVAYSVLPPTTSLGVTIGNRQGATDRTFDGQIDDLRIYNYALTPTQVKTLYNNNSAVQF